MGYPWDNAKTERLLGRTIVSITADEDDIIFYDSQGGRWHWCHHQDCCESVYVEDVIGNWNDLLGYPLTMAEEVNGEAPALNEWDEDYEWTFYKFATVKGYVTIRWYGTSNGYYSTSVSLNYDGPSLEPEVAVAEPTDLQWKGTFSYGTVKRRVT